MKSANVFRGVYATCSDWPSVCVSVCVSHCVAVCMYTGQMVCLDVCRLTQGEEKRVKRSKEEGGGKQ